MTTCPKIRTVALPLAVIAAAVVLGLLIAATRSQAAQQFRTEDLRNVPKGFLESGDRRYAVLKEILAQLKANRRQLERIEKELAEVKRAVAPLPLKIDRTNDLLSRDRP